MTAELVGILGAVFIAGAWSYEMWEAIERHKSLIDLRFAILYLGGTLLLLAYSVLLRNAIFMAFNITLAILLFFEIAYTIGWKFGREARSRRK